MRHLICVLLIAGIAFAGGKRSILPPPDRYRGIEINGEEYAVGMVYLRSFADTVELIAHGFQAIEIIGTNAWHKQVKAIWPLSLDTQELPDCVAGLNYERINSMDEYSAVYAADRVCSFRSNSIKGGFSGSYFRRTSSPSARHGSHGGRRASLADRLEYNTLAPSLLRMSSLAERSPSSRFGPSNASRCGSGGCQ